MCRLYFNPKDRKILKAQLDMIHLWSDGRWPPTVESSSASCYPLALFYTSLYTSVSVSVYSFIHSQEDKQIQFRPIRHLLWSFGMYEWVPQSKLLKAFGGGPKLMKEKLNLRCTMWYRECVNIRHYKVDKQTYRYIQSMIQSSRYIHHVNRVYYK